MREFNELLLKCFAAFKGRSFEEALQYVLDEVGSSFGFAKVQFMLNGRHKINLISVNGATEDKKLQYKSFSYCIYESSSDECYLKIKHNKEIDVREREYINILSSLLARELEAYIKIRELEKIGLTDKMLDINNVNSLIIKLGEITEENENCVGVIFLDANNLKEVNDTYGHEAGNAMLKEIVDFTKLYFEKDMIYRIGGDEFLIIVEGVDKIAFYRQCQIFRYEAIKKQKLKVAIGYSWKKLLSEFDNAKEEADMRMYENKKAHYKSLKMSGNEGRIK